jgi:ABC-type thiamin/hydroxymethylpyrimidine transport system permease subunit
LVPGSNPQSFSVTIFLLLVSALAERHPIALTKTAAGIMLTVLCVAALPCVLLIPRRGGPA